jgi:pyruvate kinase
VTNGTILRIHRKDKDRDPETEIDTLLMRDSVIRIRAGDVLLMSASKAPGKPAFHDNNGELLSPGRISLPIPEIYRDVRPGEAVCFDDGRITGIVEKFDAEQLQIHITHTRNPVEKLAGDQGVNLPDTRLNLPALSAKDLQDLEFAARHADMIGLSFANSPNDVRALRKCLQELDCTDVSVVVKIETRDQERLCQSARYVAGSTEVSRLRRDDCTR